jgi:ABC-type multidrug transport system ATPase subunit
MTIQPPTETSDASPTPVVEVHDLAKDFGSTSPVFDGIDLELAAGETTILMGPNGSGKTILLSCLAGGLDPTEGTVEVFGSRPAAVQSRLVFLLQDGLAVDDLSGRENAQFYTRLHPAATEQWRSVADRLELDALDRRVADYSGGMRRKLELALTLSVDVPLYLLDEPTAELDPTAVERFHAMLDELAAVDRTVVMTSHLPRDLRAADRLVFFSSNGIVASGRPAALRDAVPPVVVVDDLAETVPELALDGRLFDTDAGRRGFLSPSADESTVADREDVHGIEPPNSSDVFNYYVHLHGGR